MEKIFNVTSSSNEWAKILITCLDDYLHGIHDDFKIKITKEGISVFGDNFILPIEDLKAIMSELHLKIIKVYSNYSIILNNPSVNIGSAKFIEFSELDRILNIWKENFEKI